ncbi:MAG: DASS family sodium-coupled anion symporter [archaeon GB-1867-035]|nr:DASS family sodium-coupled anion symporter [Candidatus Culexmicrobium profundum]
MEEKEWRKLGFINEKIMKLTLTILTFVIFIWVAATSAMQGKILGVVLLALILWSLYPQYHFFSSIFIILLLSLFGISFNLNEFINALFLTYGRSGLWIIISGFILSEGMEVSGLARRIALKIVTSLGGDPAKIILAVALANLAVAPLSPSTTAKAFLLLPICMGLVKAFGVEKGKSNYGAGVMIMAMAANNICSTGFLTATVPNPISASYIEDAAGISLSWFEWLRMALPLTLILLIFSWLVCKWMFKPEVKKSSEALKNIWDMEKRMGVISRKEILVALLFSISLTLWITEKIHGLNSGLLSLALSLLLFLPGIEVIRVRGFAGEVPWGSITLFAASMLLAKSVSYWKALDPVAYSIFESLSLHRLPPLLFLILVIIVCMFIHVIFTSTTVYATVMIPLSISLAKLQMLPVQMIAIPVAFLTPIALILPVNTIPNLVFYSSGYFTQKQMITYGLIVSLMSAFLIILIGLPYWLSIGLI